MKPFLGFIAALAAGLAGCGHPGEPEETTMPRTATARRDVPPIDAEIPARLETATFALG